MEPTLRSFCSGNRNLNPWTAGEVLSCVFFHLFKASHLSVQATFRLLMTRTSSNSHQLLNEMCPQGAFSLLHSLISTCQYEFLRNLLFKIFFFLMWAISKVFIEFVTTLILFYVLILCSQGMWDPRSLTRGRTHTPGVRR